MSWTRKYPIALAWLAGLVDTIVTVAAAYAISDYLTYRAAIWFGSKSLLEIFSGDLYSQVFIFGIVGSVWVQTSVASFFDFSDAYNGVPMRGGHFVEKWSTLFLVILASGALATMGNFVVHMAFTMAYLTLMLSLDIYVWINCKRSSNGRELAKMCKVLMVKIDGVSVGGLGVLLVLVFFLGAVSASTLSQILRAIAQSICTGSSCLPHGSPMEADLGSRFREIFISGAIGFQILASSWLAAISLWEWQCTYTANDRRWVNLASQHPPI